MSDYIKREGAIDAAMIGFIGKGDHDPLTAIVAMLRVVPAADVAEVRHGHWAMLSYDEAICSRCGYDRNTPFDSTREARERWGELPPYCEMCGAKMDGWTDNG